MVGAGVSKKWENIAYAVASVALVLVNTLRIINLPATFDETAISAYINWDYPAILGNHPTTANLHVLTALTAKFLTGLLGDHLWVYRIMSWLALPVYLVFSVKICHRLFQDAKWRLTVFLALNLCPLLFQFWGLARGYAPANAFALAALHFALRYLDERKTPLLQACLTLLLLMVLGNMTYVHVYAAMALLLGLYALVGRRGAKAAFPLAVLAANGAVAFWAVGYKIMALKKLHELYYGGTQGFVEDTVKSVIHYSFNLDPVWHKTRMVVALCAVLVGALLPGLWWLRKPALKSDGKTAQTGMFLWLLMMLPCLFSEVQWHLLDTPLMIDRTAQLFVPFFLLQLFYSVATQCGVLFQNAVAAITAAIALANFYNCMNLRSSTIWYSDEFTYVILDRIDKETGGTGKQPVLHTQWFLFTSPDFHAKKDYGGRIHVTYSRDYQFDTTSDYQFGFKDWQDKLPGNYVLDTSFRDCIFLYRKK